MGQAHRDIEIGTMNHDSNLLKILPGHPQKAIPLYSSSGKRIISDPDMCLSPPLPAAVGHQHHQNKSLVGHRPSTESIHNTPLRQIFHSLIILQFFTLFASGLVFAMDGAVWPPMAFFLGVVACLGGFFGNIYNFNWLLYGAYGISGIALVSLDSYMWFLMTGIATSGTFSVAMFGKTTILYILSSSTDSYHVYLTPGLFIKFIFLSTLMFSQLALMLLSLVFLVAIFLQSRHQSVFEDTSKGFPLKCADFHKKPHEIVSERHDPFHQQIMKSTITTFPDGSIFGATDLSRPGTTVDPSLDVKTSNPVEFSPNPALTPFDVSGSFILQMDQIHRSAQENTLNAQEAFESIPLSANSTYIHNSFPTDDTDPLPVRKKSLMTPEKLVKELEEMKKISENESRKNFHARYEDPAALTTDQMLPKVPKNYTPSKYKVETPTEVQ